MALAFGRDGAALPRPFQGTEKAVLTPCGFTGSGRDLFVFGVPQGRPIIARRFNAGLGRASQLVPEGRLGFFGRLGLATPRRFGNLPTLRSFAMHRRYG